jgi:hypothetical protein
MKRLLIGYAVTTFMGLVWLGLIFVVGFATGEPRLKYLLPVFLLLPEAFLIAGSIDVNSIEDVGLGMLVMTLKIGIGYGCYLLCHHLVKSTFRKHP